MKVRKFLLTGMVASIVAAATGAFGQNITVVVNGQPVEFANQPPIMLNDRVLVPLRGVFEDLGARVEWDPETQTVTAFHGDTRIKLTIGQNTAAVDGDPVQLDVPAQVIQGSTMVPLRFVGEALGDDVHWDPSTNTVNIKDGGNYDLPRRHHHHDGDNIPPPPPPPIDVPPPGYDQPPVIYQPDTVIPINFGIDFDFGHARIGQRIDTPVPSYPGLPPGCHAVGVIDRVSYFNNQPSVEINYSTIVTPTGRRIPIQGHAVEMDPRMYTRRPGGTVVVRDPHFARRQMVPGSMNHFAIRLEKPLRIGPDRGRPGYRPNH